MRSRLRGLVLLALGGFAIAAPIFIGQWSIKILGLLLIGGGLWDLFQMLWGRVPTANRSFAWNLALSIIIGVLFFWTPHLVFVTLMWVVSAGVAAYGVGRILAGFRKKRLPDKGWGVFNGVVIVGCAAILWLLRSSAGLVAAGIGVGLYCFALGWSLLFAPEEGLETEEIALAGNLHPDEALSLPAHAEFGRVRSLAIRQELTRRPIDIYWVVTLLLTFFAIHLGRMDSEWTWLGLAGPLVATIGDLLATLLLSVAVILPVRLLWRVLTRPVEKRLWYRFIEKEEDGQELRPGDRAVRWWLTQRVRFSVRMRLARSSFQSGLWDMIEQGLPIMALLVAVNPIWGFSWYFNSENWASGLWQKLTEARVDVWRAGMIDAVQDAYRNQSIPPDRMFDVTPKNVANARDFSFVVIGDSGEGDSSQFVLKDQLLAVASKPQVQFFVISSDVIYPDGAMKDYEFKLYLPFKGISQPIFAIPGNHDWFSANEAFNANFFEPVAAQAANKKRLDLDLRVTSSSDRKIEEQVRQAGFLRREYGLKTGLQRAPFFEIHAAGFSLIAGDTGILRRFDDEQMSWFRAALERSKGNYTMVLLGHPVYALGHYQADAPDFGAIHKLLKEYKVPLVMAGDTHDFEYYRERDGSGATMHHFVNGGGGAYLSVGAALDWPAISPVNDWALYPSHESVERKLESETPIWKWPLWWWVKNYQGWPAGAEVLSAVFDFNRAPFYQSFIEVNVEGSANRVRLVLYGVYGPLKWSDLQIGGSVIPAGSSAGSPVEFVFPMEQKQDGGPA